MSAEKRHRLGTSVHIIPSTPKLAELVGGWVADQLTAAETAASELPDGKLDWQALRIQTFADPIPSVGDRIRLDVRISATYREASLGEGASHGEAEASD